MAMDWLGLDLGAPDAEPTLADLQRQLAQKEAELAKVRSTSHQQLGQSSQTQDLLLSQIKDSVFDTSNDDLGAFDWEQVLGYDKKEKKVTDDEKAKTEAAITFKSKEDLNRWMDQRDEKKRKEASQLAEKAAQVQQELLQKFLKDHPDLVEQHELVGRLWNQSMSLNPNIDPNERFKGVINESKFLVEGGFGSKGRPSSNPNPYMPPSPSSGFTGRSQQQSSYEPYNMNSHQEELKLRQQSVLDKMFG